MTETDHSFDRADCGGEVAAYALGALDPAELESFRAHLETCGICQDELAAFQSVVDMLPLTAPRHPASKRLRRRVLGAIAREPKLKTGAHRPRRTAPVLPRLPIQRVPLAFGLAVTIVAIAVGSLQLGASRSARTRIYSAQVTGPGSAKLTVTGPHAELVVHHLPAPPAGEIYEVWLVRPGNRPAPTSALFSVTAAGEGDVEVPGNLHGVKLVMVTPEPAGGSRVPTHPAVIRAQLS
jgi:hypothetical protein